MLIEISLNLENLNKLFLAILLLEVVDNNKIVFVKLS